jgi:hypothetical protein
MSLAPGSLQRTTSRRQTGRAMRPHRQIAICRYLTDECGAAAATAILAVAFSVSLGTMAISGGL